jgi:surfactin synthase thioesterase subunit
MNRVNARIQEGPTGQQPITSKFYMFPHAGGSVEFYVPFSRAFSPGMKRIAIRYPGSSDRRDVTPISSIPALADDIYKMLAKVDGPDARLALFGHSMGALVAFEVALRFESARNPVTALFVSACGAPGSMNYEYFRSRSDDELVKMLAEVTDTHAGFLDEQFVATILPTVRSYKAIADYTSPTGAAVSCPIYAFAGDDDPIVDHDSVRGWSEFTMSEFAVRTFPGGHFFLTEHVREVAEEVEARISHAGS